MPEETTPEVVETPTEVVETTPEATPVEEVAQTQPELIAIPLTMYGTQEQLEVIARHYKYPSEIIRPDTTPETPLQDRFMPNPQTPVEWLTDYAKEVMANLAAEAFAAETQREEAERTAQAREYALNLARQAIQ